MAEENPPLIFEELTLFTQCKEPAPQYWEMEIYSYDEYYSDAPNGKNTYWEAHSYDDPYCPTEAEWRRNDWRRRLRSEVDAVQVWRADDLRLDVVIYEHADMLRDKTMHSLSAVMNKNRQWQLNTVYRMALDELAWAREFLRQARLLTWED